MPVACVLLVTSMREALYARALPELGDDVSVADDTWHLVGRIKDKH